MIENLFILLKLILNLLKKKINKNLLINNKTSLYIF